MFFPWGLFARLFQSYLIGYRAFTLLFLGGFVASVANPPTVFGALTVPTAPAVVTYASDAFNRTATNGWGSADVGGVYSTSGGALSDYSTSPGLGSIVALPGGGRHLAELPDASARDVDVRFQVQTNQAPAGDSQYAYAVARRAEGNTEYRAQIRLAPGGAVGVQAVHVNFSYAVPIGSEVIVPGLTVSPNVPISVHFQATGANPTTLRINAWANGQTEPAAWEYSVTDSTTDLQEAGDVGLSALLGSASTATPVTFGFSNFQVQSVGPPPNVIWKPYLNQVGSTSAIVQWATYAGANPLVAFSTDTTYSSTANGTSRTLSVLGYQLHTVALTGLQPSTTYFYKIFNDGADELPTETLTLTTASAAGGTSPFTFLAFGDYGSNSSTQKQLRDQILRDNYQFLLLLGDNAYPNGTYQNFNANVFPVYRDIFDRKPLFPALGNHDVITLNGAPYLDVFDLPRTALTPGDQERYYSFDWSNAHFVVLDSDSPLNESPTDPTSMYAWLKSDLSQTVQPWKIVAIHYPAYSVNGNTALVDTNLVPIFEQYGVDLVLSGHAHDYERTFPLKQGSVTTTDQGGIVYIVSGSGDSDSQSCGTAAWEAYNVCHTARGNYTRISVNNNQIALQQVDYTGSTIDSYGWIKSLPTATATPTLVTAGTATPTPVPSASSTPTVTTVSSATPTPAPTVTATNTAVPTATPTATASPAPTSTTGTVFTLYGDSLAPGWSSASWGATVNTASTSYIYSGSDAVAFTITGKYGAFAPYLSPGSFDTTPYTNIRFYINGEATGGQQLGLMMRVHSTQAWSKLVKINSFISGGSIAANQWRQVDIPLSALGVNATQIDRIALQDVLGTAQPEVSVDQIELH